MGPWTEPDQGPVHLGAHGGCSPPEGSTQPHTTITYRDGDPLLPPGTSVPGHLPHPQSACPGFISPVPSPWGSAATLSLQTAPLPGQVRPLWKQPGLSGLPLTYHHRGACFIEGDHQVGRPAPPSLLPLTSRTRAPACWLGIAPQRPGSGTHRYPHCSCAAQSCYDGSFLSRTSLTSLWGPSQQPPEPPRPSLVQLPASTGPGQTQGRASTTPRRESGGAACWAPALPAGPPALPPPPAWLGEEERGGAGRAGGRRGALPQGSVVSAPPGAAGGCPSSVRRRRATRAR